MPWLAYPIIEKQSQHGPCNSCPSQHMRWLWLASVPSSDLQGCLFDQPLAWSAITLFVPLLFVWCCGSNVRRNWPCSHSLGLKPSTSSSSTPPAQHMVHSRLGESQKRFQCRDKTSVIYGHGHRSSDFRCMPLWVVKQSLALDSVYNTIQHSTHWLSSPTTLGHREEVRT